MTAREVARQVYGESGLRGFYRGFGVSVLQFAPTSAVSYVAPPGVVGSVSVGCRFSTHLPARIVEQDIASDLAGTPDVLERDGCIVCRALVCRALVVVLSVGVSCVGRCTEDRQLGGQSCNLLILLYRIMFPWYSEGLRGGYWFLAVQSVKELSA